jgi:hypothetical protein
MRSVINVPLAYYASFSVLFTVLHDRELTGSVYGYDPDGDAITAQLISGPTNGALTLNADGSFTYTPNTHYVGPDSFIYQWSDSVAVGNLAEVRITVLNNAPTVEIDYEEYGFSGNTLYVRPPGILSHVYDPDGDSMEPIIVASTTQGSLQVYPDGGFVYNIPDSYWDYHQDSIFVQDSFRITYKDVVGAQSVTEKLVSLMSGPFVPPGSSDEGNQNAANPPPDVATAIRNRAGGVQLVNTYWVAILAREPDPQGGALRRGGDTGHTFIAAVDFGNNPQQPNTITIMGFGPAGQYNWWDALNNRVVRGIVADNSRHRWTIGAAWQINQQQYQAVINRFNRDANNPPNYSVFDYNRTNWAFDVLNRETHIGWRPQLVQERVTSRWLLAPAQVGVELRRNPVPQNGIRLEP